jgi:hypothetical protein
VLADGKNSQTKLSAALLRKEKEKTERKKVQVWEIKVRKERCVQPEGGGRMYSQRIRGQTRGVAIHKPIFMSV